MLTNSFDVFLQYYFKQRVFALPSLRTNLQSGVRLRSRDDVCVPRSRAYVGEIVSFGSQSALIDC